MRPILTNCPEPPWKGSLWKRFGPEKSRCQARRLLTIRPRYEMDGFLKDHGVFLDLTLKDVRRDSEVARALPQSR